MRLRPIERVAESSRGYPERKASVLERASRWARRAGAVALATTAFWMAGCDLFFPRMGGDISGPIYVYFACEEDTETTPLGVPGTYEGTLCETGKYAWGSFDVTESTTVEVSLDGAGGAALAATASVIDQAGVVVAEVPAGDGLVAVEVTPGAWRVAVTGGEGSSLYESFELTVQAPAEE